MMRTTIAGTQTEADTFEDSALLAGLDDPSGQVHVPSDGRLFAQGLVESRPGEGVFLTADGHAAAEELRARERDLITDDMLPVILASAPRLTAARAGWTAGATWYEERPYLELHQPSGAEPGPGRKTLETLSSRLYDQLAVYSEVDDNHRLFFGALRPSPRRVTPRLGVPDEARSERIHAAFHADAVWTSLCSSHRPATHPGFAPGDGGGSAPMGYSFHHYSRTAFLSLDDWGRYCVSFGITGEPDAGRSWTGHRADIAVKAMARDLYRTACAHEYRTGSDSCPGCDHTGELFEQRHEGELAPMPGSLPVLMQVIVDTADSPFNVMHKFRPKH